MYIAGFAQAVSHNQTIQGFTLRSQLAEEEGHQARTSMAITGIPRGDALPGATAGESSSAPRGLAVAVDEDNAQ